MTEAVPSYLSPTGQEIVFLLLGAVAVGSALLVVTTRQLVHAALWLVVCFGALAGGYLVLTAEFVAWVQVLIYVGAVVVLMLFGIMLTRAPIGPSEDLDSGNRPVAAVVAVATAALLVTVVIDGFRTAYTPLRPGKGAAQELGASVFATWVLPFEALSVLLLAALIGAIVLSRTDIPGGAPAQQTSDPPSGPPGTTPSSGATTSSGTVPSPGATASPGAPHSPGGPETVQPPAEPANVQPQAQPEDTSPSDRTTSSTPPEQTGGH
ncbi:NADH-quinone oxidoreductase subunit J [Nonomuraea mesophila]|uniref:NADH-quinone oxidoreductase subunit J n=1 Tax=Nonomuraea mesophila TaxID=2530382 RepID=UPI00140DFF16|nr:NADH-quinone oxidoreductase subunit J [Nonomuraea mesophila]